MTAGSGILHQEMPQPAPHMLGLRLWVNLARDDKMADPKYRDIQPGMIAVAQEDGVTIVMNADEERRQAFRELESGTFIKHG